MDGRNQLRVLPALNGLVPGEPGWHPAKRRFDSSLPGQIQDPKIR